MNNKNKGFTLVELLAVIVIISILSVITVTQVSPIIAKSKKSLSSRQQEIVEDAARVYFVKEGSKSTTCVNISYLISKGYIDSNDVVDPEDKESLTGSVLITNLNNQYSYKYQSYNCNYTYEEVMTNIKSSAKDYLDKNTDKTCVEISTLIDEEYISSNDTINPTTLKEIEGRVKSVSGEYIYSEETCDSKLPSDYQEVEYLESTGTQYIDTGVVPQTTTTIDIKWINLSINKDESVFECTCNPDQRFALISRGENYFSSWLYQTPNITFLVNDSEIQHTIFNNVEHRIINNGTDYGTLGTTYNNSFYKLYLFAGNDLGSVSRFGNYKIYLCDIYDNNSLVRDLVPCYRKSDNKPGMYDLVNDVFYINSGTGEFIVGPDVD